MYICMYCMLKNRSTSLWQLLEYPRLKMMIKSKHGYVTRMIDKGLFFPSRFNLPILVCTYRTHIHTRSPYPCLFPHTLPIPHPFTPWTCLPHPPTFPPPSDLPAMWQVIFEGIPVDSSDLSRRFRGFIAVDELSFTDAGQCSAFCTFEGGTCGWTQDSNDDFEWTLVSL